MYNRLFPYLFLVLFSCITACGDDDDDNNNNNNNNNTELYLRYKVDGVQHEFTSNTVYWGSNGGCIYASIDGSSSELGFEFDNLSEVKGADLLAMQGKQFSFNNSDSISADFLLEQNTIGAYSYNASNPYPANFIKITSVKQDTRFPAIVPEKMYRMQGTFECMVDDGPSTYHITDGEFALIFQEE